MAFDPIKIKQHATLEEVEQEIFSQDEISDIKARAEDRSRIRRALSDQVSKALARYMTSEDIGFNELERRLQMSSATIAKLIRGQANITLETIAAVSQVIGLEPQLIFYPAKGKD